MTDRELILAAVAKSGLSHTAFAREVVLRDGRQVRRWLAGHPIPTAAREWLVKYVSDQT